MQYRPGDKANKSGQFKMIDEEGNVINIVDVQKGQKFPPCPSSGCHFEE